MGTHGEGPPNPGKGNIGSHRDHRYLPAGRLGELQRGLDGVLIARVQSPLDAFTLQAEVASHLRHPVGVRNILRQHHDVQTDRGELACESAADDTRTDDHNVSVRPEHRNLSVELYPP